MPIAERAVRDVFRALTRESLAAVSVARLVDAAIAAFAEAGAPTPAPPPEVSSDADVAARFVCDHIATQADPHTVLRALARAADDPHTLLLTSEAGASLMAVVSGKPCADPGMAFQRLADGRLMVTEVVAGGAAASAGIEAGDVVCAVAGERPTRGIEVNAAIFASPRGGRVAIDAERVRVRRTLSLEVTEASLPLVFRRIVEPRLGYIRLRWITTAEDPERDTAALLRRALDDLAHEGVRAIVLDLRGNEGGYGIARVASVLTDGDPVAIYRHPSGDEAAARVGERSAVRLPLAVLVDNETSSAAEMIALALKEHEGARIIGDPTAGALNVPVRKPIGDRHVLMFPGTHVLGPRTRTPNAGMRVTPDVRASRTAEDLAEARDPQLDAARRDLFASGARR